MNLVTDTIQRWLYGDSVCKCEHRRWQHALTGRGFTVVCWAQIKIMKEGESTAYCNCMEYNKKVRT